MTINEHDENSAPAATPATLPPVGSDVPVDELSMTGDAIDVSEAIESVPATGTSDGAVGSGRRTDNPDNYVGYQLPRGPNPNITETDAVFRPTLRDEQQNDPFHVTGLPCDVNSFNSLLESYPSINYEIGSTNRDWAAEIQAGSNIIHQGNFLSKVVNRDGSLWGNRVASGAGTIGLVRPRISNPVSPGTHISGELASARVRQIMGTGQPSGFPLYHSGFWVSLKAPSSKVRLELQRRIDSEKIELGRMTSGMAFSNVSVYIKSYLTDFVLAHVSTANVRYNQVSDLKDLILSTDIPTLIWGILTTIYPNGYPYHQPCMNDPSQCQHVVKELVDINKIHFVDKNRLSEMQLKFLARRTDRLEPKELEAYRDAHTYNAKGLITLKTEFGEIKVQLKVPTVTEYASAGFAWVDGISNDIQRAFGSDLVGERRNTYILERARATSMCEYSHWIKEIGLPDGSSIIDLDTIRATLADLGGEPALAEDFFTKVVEYIEDVSLAIVALPRFDCPSCGKPATAEEAKHPYLNPIDVEALFFTMLDQHLAKVLT